MDRNVEHAESNRRAWNSRASTFDQRRFHAFRWLQKKAIRLVDLSPGIRFLDIGCATGWAVRYVAATLRDEGEFYGIDISDAMIERARVQSRDFGNVHFYAANAEQLPLEDGSVDRAICTNSFHHYFDPSMALAEIHRVLAAGGRIYIMDLTADDLLMRTIDRLAREKEHEHVRFYSSREYQDAFRTAGLGYLGSQLIVYPIKIHIAEKSSSTSGPSQA
jgi:ubiquinone/menaquinone biosynthesis C-methylase UbiE